MSDGFSWLRCRAMLIKEFIQMRRDKLTFAFIVGIPLLELVLFGYAINTNPKHLPTALVSEDRSVMTRQFLSAMKNTQYFDFVKQPKTVEEAEQALAIGQVLLVVHIPPHFTHDLIKGVRPAILVEGDGTDPIGVSNALQSLQTLSRHALDPQAKGPLHYLKSQTPAFDVITHVRYNPENITQYNIVPGLLGVVLTMTMVMITSLAITRERERGTMESLLATPVKPIEVMVGKIMPYIIVGYVQIILMIFMGWLLFSVPFFGSLGVLLISALPFIAANLAVGLTFSSIAKNQLQAVQMAIFFFLPSILLSGFMFPFKGMPTWAQPLGEILPLTHFLRIIRGIMLKGNGWEALWPNIWPILLFATCALAAGVKRYRQTLD